jgi:hypothetical protein
MFDIINSFMSLTQERVEPRDSSVIHSLKTFGLEHKNSRKNEYAYTHLELQESLIELAKLSFLRFRQILAHLYPRAMQGFVSDTKIMNRLLSVWIEQIFAEFITIAKR